MGILLCTPALTQGTLIFIEPILIDSFCLFGYVPYAPGQRGADADAAKYHSNTVDLPVKHPWPIIRILKGINTASHEEIST
jgi:hypothetical protein